jgi:hypothetical protein
MSVRYLRRSLHKASAWLGEVRARGLDEAGLYTGCIIAMRLNNTIIIKLKIVNFV